MWTAITEQLGTVDAVRAIQVLGGGAAVALITVLTQLAKAWWDKRRGDRADDRADTLAVAEVDDTARRIALEERRAAVDEFRALLGERDTRIGMLREDVASLQGRADSCDAAARACELREAALLRRIQVLEGKYR